MSKLLIVDDESKITDVLAEYAEFEGYETDKAFDGMEAIKKCKENREKIWWRNDDDI